MESAWTEILINGAVVLFLWGLVWRSNGQRFEKLERAAAESVEKEYCALQHRELRDDLRELKDGQKELLVTLHEVEQKLARSDRDG